MDIVELWLEVDSKEFVIVQKGRKFGFADRTGKLICPIKYTYAVPFSYGLAVVKGKKGFFEKEQWGVINEEGKETWFSERYDEVRVIGNKLIAVKLQDKWGLLDNLGFKICNFKYDECPSFFINGFARVICNGLYAFIDEKGHQICAAKYTKVHEFSEDGVVMVWLGHKAFRMNKKGVELKQGNNKNYI